MEIAALILVCLTTFVSSVPTSSIDCDAARSHFKKYNFSTAVLERSQVEGGLCGTGQSCCSQSLRAELVQNAPMDMKTKLVYIKEHKNSLVAVEQQLLETYRNALNESQANILETLHNDLRFSNHNDSVEVFFRTLRLYLLDNQLRENGLNEDNANIVTTAVQNLFSDLFVSVFHQTANPPIQEFSDNYKTCLRRQTAIILPFGDHPQRLAKYFKQSFHADHLALRSTKSLIEVLSTTANMNVTFHEQCTQKLANIMHCPACNGYPELKPCRDLCQNVMRGCLAAVYDVSTPWKAQIDKTIRLLKKTSETNHHVETALLILSRRLLEAVSHAVDNGDEIVKTVKATCGEPKGSSAGIAGTRISDAEQHLKRSLRRRSSSPTGLLVGSSKALSELKEALQHKLAHITDVMDNLSERICDDLPDNQGCWNGHEIGSYTKPVAGKGMEAQKSNPEMALTHSTTTNYISLVEHSLHMKILTSAVSNAAVNKLKPASDNYQIETRQKETFEEGSGDQEGSGGSDDEGGDDEEGSGSGDGVNGEVNPETVQKTLASNDPYIPPSSTTVAPEANPEENTVDTLTGKPNSSMTATTSCALVIVTIFWSLWR